MIKRLIDTYFRHAAPLTLLLLLLIDVGFMLLHIAVRVGPPPENRFLLLDTEGGLPEIYQYIKEIAIAGVLALMWLRSKRRVGVYAAWALLFLYLFVDDSIGVHNRIGDALLPTSQEGSTFTFIGELFIFGTIAVTFSALIFYFYRRTTNPRARAVSHVLLALIMVFAFFSVFIDAINYPIVVKLRPIIPGEALNRLFEMLFIDVFEEGGEHIAFSFMTSLAIGLYWLIDVKTRQEGEQTIQSTSAAVVGYFEAQFAGGNGLLRWLEARGFLVNYARIKLLQALKPRLTPARQLIEHEQGVMLVASDAAQLNTLTTPAAQALQRQHIRLSSAAVNLPADGQTLDQLAAAARQKMTS